jgi:hypothetical protein
VVIEYSSMMRVLGRANHSTRERGLSFIICIPVVADLSIKSLLAMKTTIIVVEFFH